MGACGTPISAGQPLTETHIATAATTLTFNVLYSLQRGITPYIGEAIGGPDGAEQIWCDDVAIRSVVVSPFDLVAPSSASFLFDFLNLPFPSS